MYRDAKLQWKLKSTTTTAPIWLNISGKEGCLGTAARCLIACFYVALDHAIRLLTRQTCCQEDHHSSTDVTSPVWHGHQLEGQSFASFYTAAQTQPGTVSKREALTQSWGSWFLLRIKKLGMFSGVSGGCSSEGAENEKSGKVFWYTHILLPHSDASPIFHLWPKFECQCYQSKCTKATTGWYLR